MLLGPLSVFSLSILGTADLLISNGEFSLGFLIRLTVLVQFLDCFIIQNLLRKSHITLRVLMARIHTSIIRKFREHLVQCVMHLGCISFEEASATADKKGIASEDRAVRAVLKIEADAVLGVTWCVKRRHLDAITDGESGVVCWCCSNLCAIFAADNREREMFELVR